jgi:hypothetical protein
MENLETEKEEQQINAKLFAKMDVELALMLALIIVSHVHEVHRIQVNIFIYNLNIYQQFVRKPAQLDILEIFQIIYVKNVIIYVKLALIVLLNVQVVIM